MLHFLKNVLFLSTNLCTVLIKNFFNYYEKIILYTIYIYIYMYACVLPKKCKILYILYILLY